MRDHTRSFKAHGCGAPRDPRVVQCMFFLFAVHVCSLLSVVLFLFTFFILLLYVLFLFTFADLLLYFDTALRLRPVGHGTLV